MVPHFSIRVITDDGTVTFSFNRIYTIDGTIYIVFFTDIDHKVKQFQMAQSRHRQWAILNKVVYFDWLVSLEKELVNAIIEH